MPVTSALVMGGASIINSTVDNLFRSPVYAQQIESMKVQDRLAVLSNTQRDILAIKLQSAQTDTERMKLILDAASKVSVESVDSTGEMYEAAIRAKSQQNLTTVLIIIGSVGLLIGTVYLIKSKKI